MALALSLRQLSSRLVREQITQNSPTRGIRYIGRSNNNSSGGVLGFFKGFWNKTVDFTGWIFPDLNFNSDAKFTNAWSNIVRTGLGFYNFNWNLTDAQLDQQLNSLKLQIAGQLGETAGNAAGWLTCGIIPSLGLTVINEPLGLYVLQNVGEEALEEFAANLQMLLRAGANFLLKSIFFSTYKNVRKSIKKYIGSKSSKEKGAINNFFGGNLSNAIETWGEEGSKPWSFRLFVEEKIESIENPYLQEFFEEAHEEFLDSCIEAGYVVANSLDSWVLQQNLANQNQSQLDQIYELYPNREVESERIVLYGGANQIQTQALEAMTHYQLLDNRDVGQWVGTPLRESISKPHLTLAIKILLRGSAQPPWINADKSHTKRAQITIPNIDRSKLDWSIIKAVAGGTNGYLWGRYRNAAHFTDGNVVEFYTATEQEGEQLLDRLLPIINADLVTFNSTEEVKKGSRQKYTALYKESTRVYPAFLVVINHQKILAEESAITKTTGVYKERKYRIPLYTETKPEDFEIMISEIITTPGN